MANVPVPVVRVTVPELLNRAMPVEYVKLASDWRSTVPPARLLNVGPLLA